ncbi:MULTISPECIES: hypothetical protein [Paenibacillus]
MQGPYGVELAQIAVEGSSTYRIRDAIDYIVGIGTSLFGTKILQTPPA